MKIAILSYGRLTKTTALTKTKWTNKNGPVLPIELCRVSQTGKLVLAINEECGVENAAYFATAKGTDLNKVIPAFMKQENIGEKQIGVVDIKNKIASEKANKYAAVSKGIAQWARKNGVDAVVFNGLGRKFKDAVGIPFGVQNAVGYVQKLNPAKKKEQVDYLKGIPAGINTPVLALLKVPAAKAKKAAKK